jgi:hypothetical protein
MLIYFFRIPVVKLVKRVLQQEPGGEKILKEYAMVLSNCKMGLCL